MRPWIPSRSMRNSLGFSMSLGGSAPFGSLGAGSALASFLFLLLLRFWRRRRQFIGIDRFDLRLIAEDRERRGFILAQGGDVDPSGFGIGKFEINIPQHFVEVAVGEEVEIFAIQIEDRAVAVGHAVGNRADLLVGQRVQIDDAVVVFRVLVVGQPLAVGRPRIILHLGVARAVDLHLLLLVDIDVPEPQVFIAPGQLLAVGRPHRRELKALGSRW